MVSREDAGDDLWRVVPGQARQACLSFRLARKVEERGQRRPLAQSRRPLQAAGLSKMRIGPRDRGPCERRVGRPEIDADEPRPGRDQSVSGSRMFSSSFQRWLRSRATHQSSSVPTSVIRLSSVTGTAAPSLAVDLQRHVERSSALRGRRPSPRSTTPAGSFLRTVELKNRNSAGSPTVSPNSTGGDRRAGPFLHAERHDAERLERRRQARHRRHRALDADVVGARGAAADADAAAAAREAVVRGAARDGVIEIRRLEHVTLVERREAFLLQPARSARRRHGPRSAVAFITPPLKRTCVGQASPLGPRRIGDARFASPV